MAWQIRERPTGTHRLWLAPTVTPPSGWYRMPNTPKPIRRRPLSIAAACSGGSPATKLFHENRLIHLDGHGLGHRRPVGGNHFHFVTARIEQQRLREVAELVDVTHEVVI